MHRKLGKRTFCLNFCSSWCRHNSQAPSSWFSDRISILSCLFVEQLLPQRVSLNLRSSVFKTTKHLKFKIEAQNSRFFNFQSSALLKNFQLAVFTVPACIASSPYTLRGKSHKSSTSISFKAFTHEQSVLIAMFELWYNRMRTKKFRNYLHLTSYQL